QDLSATLSVASVDRDHPESMSALEGRRHQDRVRIGRLERAARRLLPKPVRLEQARGPREEEGKVIHDELGLVEQVPDADRSIEPARQPERRRGGLRHLPGDEDEAPSRSEHLRDLSDEERLILLEDVPERAEAGDDVELSLEGQVERVPANEGHRRAAGRALQPALGLREHPRAPVDADDRLARERAEPAHRRSGPAADVEDLSHRCSRFGGARRCDLEHLVRRAEGREIELRREQVVAAIGRRERLLGELEEGRSVRMKHGSWFLALARPAAKLADSRKLRARWRRGAWRSGSWGRPSMQGRVESAGSAGGRRSGWRCSRACRSTGSSSCTSRGARSWPRGWPRTSPRWRRTPRSACTRSIWPIPGTSRRSTPPSTTSRAAIPSPRRARNTSSTSRPALTSRRSASSS